MRLLRARATGCSTSAARRARGCSTRAACRRRAARWSGIDRAPLDAAIPGARILVGDVFTMTSAELRGELAGVRRRALRHGARHHRHALARSGALRGAVRARARDRELMLAPGGNFVGKLFQGPDWSA